MNQTTPKMERVIYKETKTLSLNISPVIFYHQIEFIYQIQKKHFFLSTIQNKYSVALLNAF